MTNQPATQAILTPQGPALGYKEGQIILESVQQLADSGLAMCIIE